MLTIERAIEIAAASHAGVRDKQGQPYILHPLRVMMDVQGDLARIVAVLHDVVEDTPVTIENLGAAGFSAEVLAAVELVTHREGQAYSEYVIHCKANDAARQVKLADLRDNSNLNRALLASTTLRRRRLATAAIPAFLSLLERCAVGR